MDIVFADGRGGGELRRVPRSYAMRLGSVWKVRVCFITTKTGGARGGREEDEGCWKGARGH